MKCSDCGQVVKPIVAIDIDGTLGDYHGHFEEFAFGYFDRRVDNYFEGGERHSEWAERELGCTLQEFRACKLAYRQGGLKRTMRLFEHAADLCDAVRRAGAELWLTTTRPYLRLDNVDPDTREWLRRNQIAYDFLMYDEDKYKELSRRLTDPERVVAIVDDLPDKVSEAQNNFNWEVPIWVRTIYNDDGGKQGGVALYEVQDLVIQKIKTWKGRDTSGE